LSGNGGKALYAAAATLAGGIVANALGRDATTAGQTAQNSALNNRLLHKDETVLAKKLAAKSNGKYTEAQVADALRWANNEDFGETASSNIVTPESVPKTDAMIPGKTTEASTPYLTASGQDGGVRVQNMAQVAKPGTDLMDYIQQNTAASTYSWNATAWQATPGMPTVQSNTSPFAAGWNTGDYSAGLNSGPIKVPGNWSGTVNATQQTGSLLGIPIGLSASLSLDNGGIASMYVGGGIVAGTSYSVVPRFGMTDSFTSGDTSGVSVKTSVTLPSPAEGLGTTFSYLKSYNGGTSLSGGPVTVGGRPSASATVGYNYKREQP